MTYQLAYIARMANCRCRRGTLIPHLGFKTKCHGYAGYGGYAMVANRLDHGGRSSRPMVWITENAISQPRAMAFSVAALFLPSRTRGAVRQAPWPSPGALVRPVLVAVARVYSFELS